MSAPEQDPPPLPVHTAAASKPQRVPRHITSAELFAGSRELYIRHAGETYTLRQTSKGKLILTK